MLGVTPRAGKPRTTTVTVAEAARRLDMTTGGVYSAIRAGRLPADRESGRWRIERKDVTAFKRARDRFFREAARPPRPLTDAEFIRKLWEDDPDD